MREVGPIPGPGPTFQAATRVVHLPDGLLPVPEHEAVDEVGQRLGIEGAVAARHHQRIVGGPLGGPDRHSGQVDQVEDVGVDQLGREVEGQDVEVPGRQVVLEGEEGHAGRAHGRLHVHPGGVGPLGGGVLPLVEDLVEDLEPLVGQADLVGVGVDQQPRHRTVGVVGNLGPQLPPDVAGGLGDLGQKGLYPGPEGLHLPRHPRAQRSWGRTGVVRSITRSRWRLRSRRPSRWSSRPRPSWTWWWSGGPAARCPGWPDRSSELGGWSPGRPGGWPGS